MVREAPSPRRGEPSRTRAHGTEECQTLGPATSGYRKPFHIVGEALGVSERRPVAKADQPGFELD